MQLTSTQYAEVGGRQCPICHASQLEGEGIHVEAGNAYQPVTCPNCGASWDDCYKLTGYANLTEGS